MTKLTKKASLEATVRVPTISESLRELEGAINANVEALTALEKALTPVLRASEATNEAPDVSSLIEDSESLMRNQVSHLTSLVNWQGARLHSLLQRCDVGS